MGVSNSCANHPSRVAAGICRTCRKAVCNECITKIEGINICTACLARTVKSDQSKKAAAVKQGVAARGALLALGLIFLTAVFFLYGLLLELTR